MVQRLHPKSRSRSNSEAVAHPKRGFNLIESAIVLGVVGLVIGGIWVAAAGVMETYRVNQTSSAVILTVNNMRRLLRGQFDAIWQSLGSGMNQNITRAMFEAQAIPSDFALKTLDTTPGWLANPDALATPMGTDMVITVGEWLGGAHAGKAYSIIFFGMDKSSCIKLISAISGHFQDNTDLVAIETNLNGGTAIIPVPISTASSSCAAKDPSNYLIFYFEPS